MAGRHHRLNGHESEQTVGDSEGQGSLACCSPWGRKESVTTERLNDLTTAHKHTFTHRETKEKAEGTSKQTKILILIFNENLIDYRLI